MHLRHDVGWQISPVTRDILGRMQRRATLANGQVVDALKEVRGKASLGALLEEFPKLAVPDNRRSAIAENAVRAFASDRSAQAGNGTFGELTQWFRGLRGKNLDNVVSALVRSAGAPHRLQGGTMDKSAACCGFWLPWPIAYSLQATQTMINSIVTNTFPSRTRSPLPR